MLMDHLHRFLSGPNNGRSGSRCGGSGLRLKQLMADDTSWGRKRHNASISGPSDGDVADGGVALAADVTILEIPADESAVTADGDAAVIPSKKRRRSGGPARAAREAAFLVSKQGMRCHRQPMNPGRPVFGSSD